MKLHGQRNDGGFGGFDSCLVPVPGVWAGVSVDVPQHQLPVGGDGMLRVTYGTQDARVVFRLKSKWERRVAPRSILGVGFNFFLFVVNTATLRIVSASW